MAKRSKKLPIFLIVWPFAAIILSLLVYAVVNFIFSTTNSSGSESDLFGDTGIFKTITNVILFLVGAAAVGLGPPSVIVGIVLLATRSSGSEHRPKSHSAQTAGSGMSVAGMVLGIVGLLTSWFGLGFILGIIGVSLSGVALKRRQDGRGMAIAGLVTSILAIVFGIFYLAAVTIVSYSSIQERAETAALQVAASNVEKQAEGFYAETGDYPSYPELYSRLPEDAQQHVGEYGQGADVVYIPCTGGALVWTYNRDTEKYDSIDVGSPTDCTY